MIDLPVLKRPAKQDLRRVLVVLLRDARYNRVVHGSSNDRTVAFNDDIVGITILHNRLLLAKRVQLKEFECSFDEAGK